MAFCPNCGSSVEGKFCAKCGAAVGVGADPASGSSFPTQTPSAGSSGLTDNVAGALAYIPIIGLIFLLTIPSSVELAVLGDRMIAVVYQGGKFRVSDTHQTALALSCYAIGLAGYAAIKVLAPAFYALNDARTPMIVSLVSILVNAAAASSMVKLAGLGHAGLALSTSVVALVSSVVL